MSKRLLNVFESLRVNERIVVTYDEYDVTRFKIQHRKEGKLIEAGAFISSKEVYYGKAPGDFIASAIKAALARVREKAETIVTLKDVKG